MAAKQAGSVGFEASNAQSWNGSLGVEALRSNSVREDETAVCLDCRVTFNIRNRACPKCDSEHFWLVAKWRGDDPVRDVTPPRPAFRLPAPKMWRPALRFRSAS